MLYTSHLQLSPAHLHREQAGKVVLPVVSSSDDNPLLHAVILDGAYSRSHIEIGYRGQMVEKG